MPKISAFADEISPDPQAQMDGLDANDIKFIELRGAWNVNVMDFSKDQRSDLKKQFDDRGFGIAGRKTIPAKLQGQAFRFLPDLSLLVGEAAT